jgi:hypothetical protein
MRGTFSLEVCILAREYLALNWSGKVTIQEKHNLIKKWYGIGNSRNFFIRIKKGGLAT